MNIPSLLPTLRRIAARVLAIGLVAALAWGLVAAGALLLIAVWLDLLWELAAPVRALLPGLAAAVGVLVLSLFLWQWNKRRDFTRLARKLDAVGNTGGVVVAGWELERQAKHSPGGEIASLTAGMSRVAVASAAETAQQIPIAEVAPFKPAGKAWAYVSGLALAVGLMMMFAPQLMLTQWRRFALPWDDVPPFSRTMLTLEPGDTQVLFGDALDVYATVVGEPVDEVSLVLTSATGDETVPMFNEGSGRWRAVLTRVTSPLEYHAAAARSRSVRHQIEVLTVPEITSLRVRVTPPEYAQGIGAYEGNLPPDGVAGLAGTKVQFWATSNRPLASGEILAIAGEAKHPLPMQTSASKPEEVTGAFLIEQAGKFELRVRDIAGQTSRDAIAGTVSVLKDQRPFVRLLRPRQVSLATPSAHLPIEIAAEDDYGIAKLELFRSLNDSRPRPMQLTSGEAMVRRQNESVYLPLSEYGLQPGDMIKLFARVEDNDPAGAKGTESQVATVHIVSQEEFERMLRAREGLNVLMSKFRQAQRRMEGLRAKNKQLKEQAKEKKGLVDKDLRQKAQELAKQLAADAAELSAAASHALPYDADASLSPQLERLAKELEKASQDLERQLQRLQLDREQLSKSLEDLAALLGEQNDLYDEEVMSPLEQLERVMPLLIDQSRFQMLVARQRDLEQRLASLAGRDGEDNPALKARMRDLQEEQQAIQAELDELLSEIEDHAAQLPEKEEFAELRETALEFVKAVRESEAETEMTEAERGLGEFSGTRGHEHAKKAADILEKFLSQCEGVGEAGGKCLVFRPGFGQCLGKTSAQMLAEMGLGQGSGGGFGQGSGGGYSARRNTGSNVGLYGGMPGLNGSDGDQNRERNSQGGAGEENFAGGASGENPDALTLGEILRPGGEAGGTSSTVPLRYRERVGQYFRKLSEELDQ